jgi:ABC-type Na+ efflux pump permease subunit
MIPLNPRNLIIIGFILVVFGFVAPFLMVMRILESTFWLNFLAYTASTLGMILGFIGVATYYRINRK